MGRTIAEKDKVFVDMEWHEFEGLSAGRILENGRRLRVKIELATGHSGVSLDVRNGDWVVCCVDLTPRTVLV